MAAGAALTEGDGVINLAKSLSSSELDAAVETAAAEGTAWLPEMSFAGAALDVRSS